MSENTAEAPHTESVSEIPSTQTDVITQTPGTHDRDQDRLSDEAERTGETADGWKLPDAEPDTKDLYVQIFVTENVPKLTPFELDDLRDIWRSMPVENPSNETGIRLHIQQVPVNRSMTVELSEQAFQEQEKKFYGDRLQPAARCTVHVVLLTRTTSDSFYSGRANAPGYMAIVDGTRRQSYGEEYTVRVATITHELLHNIVGVFDNGRSHTYSGWLDGGPTGTHGDEFHMSNMTAEKLSEDGFASSAYYESEYC